MKSKINRTVAAVAATVLSMGCTSDTPTGPTGADIVGFGDDMAAASLARMAGCFSVRYQFIENNRDDFFFDGNVEYMDVQARGDGFLVRNFLVLPDMTAFLHFTQDWTPLGDEQWRLTVSDGGGNLRYESDGAWRFNQWEGATGIAVKPNRDMQRTDYEVLERRNSFQFTEGVVIQSEINVKSLADGTPLASELGWIVYTLQEVDDSCAPAIDLANQ